MSKYSECHIVFLNSNGEKLEQFRLSGCTIHLLSFSVNPITSIRAFIELRRIIKKINPEIVHTWLYISDVIGGIAAYTCHVPNIYWGIRQSNISFSQNTLHTFLLARICGLLSWVVPDRIISCSIVAMKTHIRKVLYNRSKIIVIPNGYKTSELVFSEEARKQFRAETQCCDDFKMVGIIGRYDVQKGFDSFLRIGKLILAEQHNTIFIMVGPGCITENEELVAMINQNIPFARCLLLGQRTDIKNILCGLDLLIISSRGEAFPNVLGEAMCIGTPVITTNVGEMPIILEDLQECYAPGENAKMALAALRALSLSKIEKEKMSAGLRTRIIERYDLNKVMSVYKDIYLF